MILAITLIKLKSPLNYFTLASHYLKIMKQAKSNACLSIKSTGFWTTFYTMTLWESTEVMKTFARSGSHLEAMKSSSKLAEEIRTLTLDSSTMMKWKEAKEKLRSSGKIIKY